MKITLEYRSPTPSHCDVVVFVNGAFSGALRMRQEELDGFEQIILRGVQLPTDELRIVGDSDPPEPAA